MKQTEKNAPIFEELFNLEEIQTIQDSFARATGIASIITGADGRPITRPSNFSRLCRDVIRKTEKGLANCIFSARVIGACNLEGPTIQPCLSSGLWDAGASINVGGRHIASWLIGQVRNQDADAGKIFEYARVIGADEGEFKQALDDVTVMPLDQFRNISRSLFLIANQMSGLAFQKLEQKRFAAERVLAQKKINRKNFELQNVINLLMVEIESKKKIEKDLKKKNEYMAALHETSLGMFSRLELSQVLDSIIKRASKLTKMPDGFVQIYDQKKKVLQIKAACGNFKALKGLELKPGEGISGKVWESGESFFTDNYQEWDGKSPKPQFDFVTSAVAVPLTSGSKIEGVIGLSHHKKGNKIGPDIRQILVQFAELATIAIDNAKLFEGLKGELDKRIRLEKEREKTEAMLRQSQKMEAVGTLAGGIAHDFNNILFPVIGFSEMIMSDLPENSPIKSQLQPVLEGAHRAKDLVQQILTFSRTTEKNYNPLKMQLVVKEVLQLARASLPSTIKIVKNIPNDIGMVMADPTQVHQIVLNLITNAQHSMEENGGRLSVVLEEIVLADENLPDSEMMPGDYICLKVSDTGAGMDPVTLKRIFEPYFTTKKRGKGTGLGLAVVHGIVKNLHGEIFVESVRGKGSVFSVCLPKIVEKKDGRHMKTASTGALSGNERILVVDDEKPVLKMLTRLLTRFGYHVNAYDDSSRALNRFETAPYEVDLVITDMTMPGITGEKLVNRVKCIRPDLPVILCTGFSEKIINGSARGSDPDKILMKPAGKEELLTNIRVLLDNVPGHGNHRGETGETVL